MYPQKNFDSEFFSRSVVHLEFCTRGGKTNVEEFQGGGGEATYLGML